MTLVADAAFELPSPPGVTLFPDSEADDVVYAVTAAPRLAEKDDGTPGADLLLFADKDADPPKITWGQLTVEVALALTEAEREQIIGALTERLRARYPETEREGMRATLGAIDWVDGEVELSIGAATAAIAKPSLAADNRCTLLLSLDDQAANWLREQMLVDISYQMSLRGVRTAESQAGGFAIELAPGRTTIDTLFAHGKASAPETVQLRRTGQLRLPEDRVHVIKI